MKRRAVVIGASRGIGLAVASHLVQTGWHVTSVARTPAAYGEFHQADVTDLAQIGRLAAHVTPRGVDALLYMGGTWERDAFTPAYSFATCDDEDLRRVLDVNLLAPIRVVRALLPALAMSPNPKVVLMGSLSGLDNFPASEVANSASKFGLRGVVHALRNALRPQRIGLTVINPGNVGTPEVLSELQPGAEERGDVVPLGDLLAVIDCVLAVSRSTCVKEIDLPPMNARGA
jgi:3-oxoacyl-[acyl-carrier protein] reductase